MPIFISLFCEFFLYLLFYFVFLEICNGFNWVYSKLSRCRAIFCFRADGNSESLAADSRTLLYDFVKLKMFVFDFWWPASIRWMDLTELELFNDIFSLLIDLNEFTDSWIEFLCFSIVDSSLRYFSYIPSCLFNFSILLFIPSKRYLGYSCATNMEITSSSRSGPTAPFTDPLLLLWCFGDS